MEQKHATLVRAYFGSHRLDSPDQAVAMNRLYEKMWLYYNLFQPVMHQVAKTVIERPGERPRIRRHYDEAKTPFERLLATGAVLAGKEELLRQWREETNPRELRLEIYRERDRLLELPPSRLISDVRKTIALVRQHSLLSPLPIPDEEGGLTPVTLSNREPAPVR